MSIDERATSRIEDKLESIIRLLAAPMVKDKPLAESVPFLSGLGLDSNQIAAICDTSPGSVRARLAEAKGQRGPRRRRPPKAASKQSSQETTS